MIPFVANSVITNKFPSIWKPEQFKTACPFARCNISDFEAFNRQHYKARTVDDIISRLNDFAKSYRTVYQQARVVSVAESFGVPLIMTESSFPWDEPNDGFRELGAKVDKIGIVFRQDNFDTKWVNHEMVHAGQEYMIKTGIIPAPPMDPNDELDLGLFKFKWKWIGKDEPTLVNDAFTRIRKEVQAYFLANSGTISTSDFDFSIRALSGNSLIGHQAKLGQANANKIKSIIEIIQAVETLGRRRKDSHMLAQFIVNLLKIADVDEYIKYINTNHTELFSLK
jgi:hypothetical protein